MLSSQKNVTRIDAMDALRAVVMFCVVLTHAVIPYMTVRMPDLRWSVYEPSGKALFDWIFVTVRGFTMPVFFLIAGFWSMHYRERLSAREFLHKRAKRILLPLVWGMLIVLPVTYYVWAFGWMSMGECFLLEIFLWKFPDEIMRNLYGPVHLWFLIYLFLMMLIFLGATGLKGGAGLLKKTASAVNLYGPTSPLILCIPTVVILSLNAGAMWNFHNTILIEPMKFLHYFWFFTAGVFFYRKKENLHQISRSATLYLAVSVPLLILTKILLFRNIVAGIHTDFRLGIVNGLYVWFLTYAVLAGAFRYLNRPSRIFRYFADASYWFYLTHFTLIGLLHLMLYFTSINLYLKCLISLTLTVLICTWTYHRFVRYTFIGSTLHKPQLNKNGDLISPKPSLKFLTKFILLYVITGLAIYQYQEKVWQKEKIRYTAIITEYYWIYLKRAPDQPGLEYWVGRAMDHMGLPLVEKEAFIDEVARDRAKGIYY